MSNVHILITDIGAIILIIVNILVFVNRSNKIEHRLTKLETTLEHVKDKTDKIK